MTKKSKIYRGQRKHYNPCGCFYCTGTDKQDVNFIKEKMVDKEIKVIINNFVSHNVIVPKGTICYLYEKECMGSLCSVTPWTEKCEYLKEQNML